MDETKIWLNEENEVKDGGVEDDGWNRKMGRRNANKKKKKTPNGMNETKSWTKKSEKKRTEEMEENKSIFPEERVKPNKKERKERIQMNV